MMKLYAVKLTKDDRETILALFPDKEHAMAAGPRLRREYPRDQGILSCIQAEFDAQGRRRDTGYRLLHVWL